jgi:hypothetical protein
MQTNQKSEVLDAHGNVITGLVVPDGGRLVVSALLMDAKPLAAAIVDADAHRPHSLPLSDAERAARMTRQALADKKLSERWRHPTASAAPAQPPAPGQQDRAALYAAVDQRLSQRWKKGGAQ